VEESGEKNKAIRKLKKKRLSGRQYWKLGGEKIKKDIQGKKRSIVTVGNGINALWDCFNLGIIGEQKEVVGRDDLRIVN